MQNTTNGFSFILKPSKAVPGEVGVYAVHAIAKGVHLELFLEDFEELLYDKSEVPEALQGYCLNQENNKLLCPKYFNRMDIGNYLNHSADKQNIRYEKDRGFFANRDIAAGEELLANYQELGESEDTWAEYYRG